jgi:ribosomal protein S2
VKKKYLILQLAKKYSKPRRLNILRQFKRVTLNKTLVIDFFLRTDFHIGGNRQYLNKLITPYLVGFRHQFGIYNLNILLYNLRKVLVIVSNLSFYKNIILINTVTTETPLNTNFLNLCQKVARKTFLLSQVRWLGGSLSNYRRILKLLYYLIRLPTSIKTRKRGRYKSYLRGFNLKRVPYLPSLYISLVDHHWSINEAKSLGLKTIQCLQINNESIFGDINLFLGNSPLTLSSFLFLIKEAIIVGTLQDRLYFRNYFVRSLLRRIEYSILYKNKKKF